MAIPHYEFLLTAVLRHLSDGSERTSRETHDALAREFALSAAELRQHKGRQRQTEFANQIALAKAHLRMAKLIDSPRRGAYQITDLGRTALRQAPKVMDLAFLRRFPGYSW